MGSGDPTTPAEREALEALGYSEDWLACGILERRLLSEQYARLRAGGTRKTARYRSQTLAAWRDAEGPIADSQLDAFLALMRAEPDAKLARSAIADLIRSPRIGLEQLERIAGSDPGLLRRHEPLIRRTYLMRRMQEGVSDELLERVLEFRDASIQTGLIRDPRLTRKQAERLAREGANPTIRAQAEAWCRDKKAWG